MKSVFHSGKMFSSPGPLGEKIPLVSQILAAEILAAIQKGRA